MIEVVFSATVAGGILAASHFGDGEYKPVQFYSRSVPESEYFIKKDQKLNACLKREWDMHPAIGARSSDIFSFELSLDFGDISKTCLEEQRCSDLFTLWLPQCNEETASQISKEAVDAGKKRLKDVQFRFYKGESLRIWYGQNARDLCGLYWVLDQLEVGDSCCHQVKLRECPHALAQEKSTQHVLGWGNLEPIDYWRLSDNEKILSKQNLQLLKEKWMILKTQNSRLRVLIGDSVRSANEDFYDAYIWDFFKNHPDPFWETEIMEDFTKQQFGSNFDILLQRIDTLISEKKIDITEEKYNSLYHFPKRKLSIH